LVNLLRELIWLSSLYTLLIEELSSVRVLHPGIRKAFEGSRSKGFESFIIQYFLTGISLDNLAGAPAGLQVLLPIPEHFLLDIAYNLKTSVVFK